MRQQAHSAMNRPEFPNVLDRLSHWREQVPLAFLRRRSLSMRQAHKYPPQAQEQGQARRKQWPQAFRLITSWATGLPALHCKEEINQHEYTRS